MREQIGIKSLVRRPVQAMLLFFMFLLAAFLILAKLVEYEGIKGNIQKASEYYKEIGTLTSLKPEEYEIEQGIPIIADDEDIAFLDIRMAKSGIVEGMYNADIDANMVGTSNAYFYGVMADKYTSDSDSAVQYGCRMKVDETIAAMPEHVKDGQSIVLNIEGDDTYSAKEIYEGLEEGQRYLLKVKVNSNASRQYFFSLASLEPGKAYAYPAKNGNLDLTEPEHKILREDIERLLYNLQALNIESTCDMEHMPIMETYYYLKEGRLLTLEDHEKKNQVCVVRKDLAELRGLKVGDTISMTLRNLQYPWYGQIFENEKDTWKEKETMAKEFEIVGLYGSTDPATPITMYNSTIFIPTSCLPQAWEPGWITTDSFSFCLTSPQKAEQFEARYGKKLEKQGLKISFYENNWQDYQDSVKPLEKSALIGVAAFIATGLVLFLLFLLIYFQMMTKEYAIMRALGTNKRQALLQIQVPVLLISVLGSGIAVLGAFWYGNERIEKLLPQTEAMKDAVTIGFGKIALYGVILLAVITVLIYFYGRRIAKESVMHSNAGKKNKIQKEIILEKNKELEAPSYRQMGYGIEISAVDAQKKAGIGGEPLAGIRAAQKSRKSIAALSYISQRIRRTPVKSLLLMLITAIFIGLLSWMPFHISETAKKITAIYENTKIKGQVVLDETVYVPDHGFISQDIGYGLQEMKQIEDLYLEIGDTVDVSSTVAENIGQRVPDIIFMATADPGKLLKNGNSNIKIQYASGYDSDIFAQNLVSDKGYYAVIGSSLMEQLQITLGDLIVIEKPHAEIWYQVIGTYEDTEGYADLIAPLKGAHDLYAHEDKERYAKAEFTVHVSDMEMLKQVKKELEKIVAWQSADLPGVNVVLRDDEMIQAVQPLENNIRIIKVLYPILWVIAIAFCYVMSWLSLQQAQKEMAVMRILGTTKKKTIQLIGGVQLVNCLLGITAGTVATAFAVREAFSWITVLSAGVCFLTCVLAVTIAGTIILNKKPLLLLQTSVLSR